MCVTGQSEWRNRYFYFLYYHLSNLIKGSIPKGVGYGDIIFCYKHCTPDGVPFTNNIIGFTNFLKHCYFESDKKFLLTLNSKYYKLLLTIIANNN